MISAVGSIDEEVHVEVELLQDAPVSGASSVVPSDTENPFPEAGSTIVPASAFRTPFKPLRSKKNYEAMKNVTPRRVEPTDDSQEEGYALASLNDVLPDDEPSSALGKRVFSAASNPSPPPSPLLTSNQPHLVDLDTEWSADPQEDATASSVPLLNLSPFDRPLGGSGSFPTVETPALETFEGDLMTFESPVMPKTTAPNQEVEGAVDGGTENAYSPVHGMDVGEAADVELSDAGADVIEASDMLTGGPQAIAAADQASSQALETPPQGTLRRSARLSSTPQTTPQATPLPLPRRRKARGSPLKDSVTARNVNAAEILEHLPSPRALNIVKKPVVRPAEPVVQDMADVLAPEMTALAPPSSAQTRRRGRSRTPSPLPPLPSEGEEETEADGAARAVSAELGKRVRRQPRGMQAGTDRPDRHLGSLSPGSAGVLGALFAAEAKAEAEAAAAVDASALVSVVSLVQADSDMEPEEMLKEDVGPAAAAAPPPALPRTPQRPARTTIFPGPTALPGTLAVISPTRVTSPMRPHAQPAAGPGVGRSGPLDTLRALPPSPVRRVTVASPTKGGPSGGEVPFQAGLSRHLPARVAQSKSEKTVVPPGVELDIAGTTTSQTTASEEASAPEQTAKRDPPAATQIRPPHSANVSRLPSPLKRKASAPHPAMGTSTPATGGLGKPPSTSRTTPGSSTASGSKTVSRIPRIGTKPYARPTAASAAATKAPARGAVPASRVTKSVTKTRTKPLTPTTAAAELRDATLKVPATSTSPLEADIPAIPSQTITQPVSAEEAPAPSLAPTTELTSSPISLKRKRTSDGSPPPAPPSPPASVVAKAPVTSKSNGVAPAAKVGRPTAAARISQRRPTAHVEVDDETHASAPVIDEQPTPIMSDAAEASIPEDSLEPPLSATGRPMRRTSRGKAAPVSADGPSASALRVPARKPKPVTPPTFGGLTQHALELLTKKNTTRNQNYYATLETEIIRRAGDRPESPGMKIRTVRQRQQEEAEQGRAARAQRRSRRSGSGASDGLEDDGEDAEEAGPLPALDLGKHVRGAGEDEDWETPTKAEPVNKRSRFALGDDNEVPTRGIRWDRALFSVAYMDEIELGARSLNRDVPGKGCLAHKAKSLRLDLQGNLVNAEAPLPGIIHENIVVKKFVYEAEEAPAPEEPPKKRVTRSKKAKK